LQAKTTFVKEKTMINMPAIRFLTVTISKRTKELKDIVIASCLINTIGLITPLLLMALIDKVIPYRSFNTLYVLIIGIFSFSVFEIVMKVFKDYLSFHTNLKLSSDLLSTTQTKLFQKKLCFFDHYSEGDILARFTATDEARKYIVSTPIQLIVDTFFGIIFLGVLFHFSTNLTILILLFCPLFGGLAWINGWWIKPYIEKSFDIAATHDTKLIEIVSNALSIKSMNMESVFQKDLHDNLLAKINNEKVLKKIEILFFVLSQSLEKILTVLVWFLGVKSVLLNEMTIGQYMVFNMYIGRVTSPIMLLMNLGKDLKTLMVNIEKANPLYSYQEEDVFTQKMDGDQRPYGEISFQNVCFEYQKGSPVLKDISLNIAPGEVAGIIGHNGSGKTTFSKLLQTLYTPTSGDVFIDKVNTKTSHRCRQMMGVVLQNTSLFNTTVLENIRMMDRHISEKTVIDVSKKIGAHTFIDALPDKYHTSVGFKGSMLSGGQRQLIALARALIRNPKILILDEATSNLDSTIEQHLIDNFEYISQNKTVIMITHNPKLLSLVDKVFRFTKCKVVSMDSDFSVKKKRKPTQNHLDEVVIG
jgi:subfamily B ATP-binding cassette protein HlyB/CyaB